MKRLLLVLAMLLTTIAGACYNDRDTLGFELRNKPDVLRALTGRFDRFPPLYYEMRVKRLKKLPRLSLTQYDDLAVALDRLGRSDEALKAMEAKNAISDASIEDRYRLYANRGTIYAHHWLRSGAKPTNLAELKQAESDIAEAMRLNPKAHFGREGVQLEIIRWLINRTTNPSNKTPMSQWLESHLTGVDISRSLAGLITLGGAWESPDVALAIAGYCKDQGDEATTSFALQRFDELIDSGKHPIAADASDQAKDLAETVNAEMREYVAEYHDYLRTEAIDWSDKKTDYVEKRLEQGRHPDTDPNFWSGWVEPPLPKLTTPKPAYLGWLQALGPIILLIAALVTIRLLVNRAKRRLEASQITY